MKLSLNLRRKASSCPTCPLARITSWGVAGTVSPNLLASAPISFDAAPASFSWHLRCDATPWPLRRCPCSRKPRHFARPGQWLHGRASRASAVRSSESSSQIPCRSPDVPSPSEPQRPIAVETCGSDAGYAEPAFPFPASNTIYAFPPATGDYRRKKGPGETRALQTVAVTPRGQSSYSIEMSLPV